jgi:HSP20 family protein
MSLVRWEPLREINSLQRQMNRLFDDVMSPLSRYEDGDFAFVPAVELHETSDAIHLKLETPGMEAKDLDVQVTAESVTISGERRSETKTEEHGVRRSEFRYGRFQRTVPLPARVDNQTVQADYKDGILQLTLTKLTDEANKVVKVTLD